MNSYQRGLKGESLAEEYLLSVDFKIISRRWKTKWCEIDIVALKDSVIYFVEVKYRSKSDWGGAINYVTTKKMKQMEFAASMWVKSNNWNGEYRLAAVAIDNNIINFIELDFNF